MTLLDRTNLMGFRLVEEQVDDDRLAALLEAKVGTKGNGDNANSAEQGDDSTNEN